MTLHVGSGKKSDNREEEWLLLGQENRFSSRWAQKAHNALSNFLHTPTLLQLQTDGDHKSAKVKSKAREIAGELENILSSTLSDFKIPFPSIAFECDCGFNIRRRVDALSKRIKCIKCGNLYVAKSENGKYSLQEANARYTCPYDDCSKLSLLRENLVRDGSIVSCSVCGRKSKIVQGYRAEPIER